MSDPTREEKIRLGDALATASSVLSKTLTQFMAELTPATTGTDRQAPAGAALEAQQAYASLVAAALSFGTEIVHVLEQAGADPTTRAERERFVADVSRLARSVTGDVLQIANNTVPAAGSGPAPGRVRSVQLDLKRLADKGGRYSWSAPGTLWVRNNQGQDARGTKVSLASTSLIGPEGPTNATIYFVRPQNGKESKSILTFKLDGRPSQRVDYGIRVAEPVPAPKEGDGERRYHAVIRIQRPASVVEPEGTPAAPDVDTCILVTAVMRP